MDALATYHAMEQAHLSGDDEKAYSYLAEDYAFENVATGMSFKGRAALKALMDGWSEAFADFKMETTNVFGSGNKFAWEYVLSGTQTKEFRGMPATGKSFTLRCCSILEFEGGVFTKETAYLDVATMMRQLGHLPSPT